MALLETYAAAVSGPGANGVFPWPPPTRDPLPPFPPITAEQGDQLVWASAPYATTLPFTPPAGPDRDFYRGNFCGVRVPGVPWKPEMGGTSAQSAPLVMALDIFKYRGDDASIDKILDAHVARGYTHYQFSWGHAVEQGWSIAEGVALAQQWKARGGYVDSWFVGGGNNFPNPWNDRDKDWAFYAPTFTPWIDALKAAGCLDLVCVGWQLDGANSPMGLMSITIGLRAAIGPDVPLGMHWRNDANAWWDDDTARAYGISDRFDFWAYMRAHGLADRTYYQCDVNAPISAPDGGIQGGIRDVMRAMSAGQKVIPYEYKAQDSFDDPPRVPEAFANLTGYLLSCVSATGVDGSRHVIGGTGNGNQFPDGSAT